MMADVRKFIVLTACLVSAHALSIYCPTCEYENCPEVHCEGVQKVPDLCGCCEVCAGGVNDSCGGLSDVSCDETLVCARPLEKPEPRGPPPMEGSYHIPEYAMPEHWSSWGTCQRPADAHICQTEGNRLCTSNGKCYPEGNDYNCQCYITWTGKNCTDPEFFRTDDGEWNQWTVATEEIQKIADENRENVERKMGGSYSKFVAIEFTAKVGKSYMNYNIRMDVGTENYLEVVVYQHYWYGSTFSVIDINCPKNQEFSHCGTPCPNICGEPEPNYETCSWLCKARCGCRSGWWQKTDGTCVEQGSDCDE